MTVDATTLEGARAALFEALNVDAVLSVVDADDKRIVTNVVDVEPHPSQMDKQCTITIFATGVTPDWWQFAIRIYHSIKVNHASAQYNIGLVIAGIEDAFNTASGVSLGPSEWQIGWSDNIAYMVAQSDVVVGREDF